MTCLIKGWFCAEGGHRWCGDVLYDVVWHSDTAWTICVYKGDFYKWWFAESSCVRGRGGLYSSVDLVIYSTILMKRRHGCDRRHGSSRSVYLLIYSLVLLLSFCSYFVHYRRLTKGRKGKTIMPLPGLKPSGDYQYSSEGFSVFPTWKKLW